jgi:hypothetical protein
MKKSMFIKHYKRKKKKQVMSTKVNHLMHVITSMLITLLMMSFDNAGMKVVLGAVSSSCSISNTPGENNVLNEGAEMKFLL